MHRETEGGVPGAVAEVAGVVVSFDAGRGFGFIRSRSFAEDVFVHVSAVSGGVSLRAGQHVRFSALPDARGPRAVRVEPGRRGFSPAWSFGLGLAAALALATWAVHRLGGPWLAAWAAAVNLVAFAAYARDKRQAQHGGRRIPELVLLGLALAGGSPASALAMLSLRHKTRKPTFLIAFACVVATQAIALLVWTWPGRG